MIPTIDRTDCLTRLRADAPQLAAESFTPKIAVIICTAFVRVIDARRTEEGQE
jgi:hypothetical protein